MTRKLVGRPLSLVGIFLMLVIPIWFLLQLLGLVSSGVEQFGVFGYAFVIALLFFPGIVLVLLGMRISGDK
jgi:hypothetical protein